MHVITLTGNLLAEWAFDLKAVEAGKTHRAATTSFQVGGKGINVSRILNRLGTESLALGFAEGPMADLCTEWLEGQSIAHKFFPLEKGVRPGFVVRDTNGKSAETTFLGTDLNIPVTSWKAACQFAEQSRPNWLAICGSIPGWSGSWLRNIRQLADSGTRVAVDSYGPPLADLVKLPLELVKINRTELDRLFPDRESLSTAEAVGNARSESPVKNWIVTDGPHSIVASFQSGGTCEVIPARIKEVSPTGSGDTFLAVLLHKWPTDNNYTSALRAASACATANAASAGIGDFPLPVPERFFPEL
jgi:fructose-1-phosphate kinase PfkB-like protein